MVSLASSPNALSQLDRLNLGCGRYPKDGFLNVDWVKTPGVDVVHDLTRLPYPFDSGHFSVIEADHVLEHLPEVFEVMAELHRLLRPGGRLILRVPHFSRGFSHPEHKRGFDATFPYYFDPNFPGGYTGTHFECEKVTMRWFAQPYLKKSVLSKPMYTVGKLVGEAVDKAANLSPLVCSRLWCYYVGGFEEIEFIMRKPG